MQAHALMLALQHTRLTLEQAEIMAKLPSPLCVCKQCYERCNYLTDPEGCPAPADQSYVAPRLAALLGIPQLRSYGRYHLDATRTRLHLLLYTELIAGLLTSMLRMQHPLVGGKVELPGADFIRTKPLPKSIHDRIGVYSNIYNALSRPWGVKSRRALNRLTGESK